MFPSVYLSSMSTLSRLAFLFVAVPLLELFVLIQVGEVVGVWPTIGIVVLTGFAGAALARLEGLRTLLKIREELARGHLPARAMLDGLAILIGGLLLLTPGILTDLLGFTCLLPPTRRILVRRIRRILDQKLEAGTIRIARMEGFPGDVAGGWGASASAEAQRGDRDVEQHDDPRGKAGEIVVEMEDAPGDAPSRD